MTECERIIEKGIIPKDFLKEETLCDFLVTEDRKKLWMISLDMLLELDYSKIPNFKRENLAIDILYKWC